MQRIRHARRPDHAHPTHVVVLMRPLSVDEICLYGASPAELTSVLDASRGTRPNPSPSHLTTHMRTYTGDREAHLATEMRARPRVAICCTGKRVMAASAL